MAEEFIGRLREQVVIERAVLVPDASGNAAINWVLRAAARAALVATERPAPLVGEARVRRPAYRVTMRSVTGLAFSDRLLWHGGSYRIEQFGSDPRMPGQMTLVIEELGA